MALPAYAVFSLVWGLVRQVISQPIVNTAVDNWVKGSSNKIDDWVWAGLEQVALATHIDAKDKPAAAKVVIEEVQQKYDLAKAAGVVDDLKTPVETWTPIAPSTIDM